MITSSSQEEWHALESGERLRDRLAALGALELRLPASDSASSRRLETIALANHGVLGRAIEKLLLRWRRIRFHRETISSSPTLENYRESGKAELAVQALRDPGATKRLDFLSQVARDELFEVAPVLANRLLVEKDPVLAGKMAEVLGRLGRENHISLLKRSARHESPQVRLGAVRGLAYQDGRERNQVLIERLGDSERMVRSAACDALEETPVEEILDVLERIPAGRASDVRAGAVRLLQADLDLPRIRRLFHSYLRDADQRVSSEALLALVRVKDHEALARVEELSRAEDPRILKVVELARAAARETGAAFL